MFPAMVHPMRVLVRRPSPFTRRPHVPASIPSMVTLRPNIARSRRYRPSLHDRGGWSDLHHHFRAHCEHAAGYRSQYEFTQHFFSLLRERVPGTALLFQKNVPSRGAELLSPVAFDKYVVVAPMVPTMIHPMRMRTGRRYPYTRCPHVRVSIPTMVAPLINIARLRRAAPCLHYGARRRHLHDDFGAHRADCHDAAGNRGQNYFSHFLPFTDRASRRNDCFAISFTPAQDTKVSCSNAARTARISASGCIGLVSAAAIPSSRGS
jgi:hypothetical protein